MRGELKFDDYPLLHVLTAIEGNYGVRFTDNAAPGMLRDRFSGTLPSADLSEALSILEHTYNIKFNVNDKKIKISKE